MPCCPSGRTPAATTGSRSRRRQPRTPAAAPRDPHPAGSPTASPHRPAPRWRSPPSTAAARPPPPAPPRPRPALTSLFACYRALCRAFFASPARVPPLVLPDAETFRRPPAALAACQLYRLTGPREVVVPLVKVRTAGSQRPRYFEDGLSH